MSLLGFCKPCKLRNKMGIPSILKRMEERHGNIRSGVGNAPLLYY